MPLKFIMYGPLSKRTENVKHFKMMNGMSVGSHTFYITLDQLYRISQIFFSFAIVYSIHKGTYLSYYTRNRKWTVIEDYIYMINDTKTVLPYSLWVTQATNVWYLKLSAILLMSLRSKEKKSLLHACIWSWHIVAVF